MTREGTQTAVAAAVERGELPRGGPSDAAALGLLDQLPDGYWSGWTEATAERIRRAAAANGGGERP